MLTHRLRLALIPATVVLAVVAEWNSYQPGNLELVVADGVVGVVLVVCGMVAKEQRSRSRSGTLMVLAGMAWFAGNFGQAALFWHRGPLVYLHISYPTGRLHRRLAATTVVLAFADALFEPWARNDVVTVALAALVAVAAVDLFVRTSGPARRAGVPALAAALAYAGILAAASVQRLASSEMNEGTLLAYDAVVATVAVVLLVDLLYGRWTEATVAELVVGLGDRAEMRSLRDQLARALGDPSLAIGYWMDEQARYVDDAGRPLELPAPGAARAMTAIDDGADRVAILVHDAAILDDQRLVGAVASATRLAVANARLQAEVRARLTELSASRRRIVEATDAQRWRLERELSKGAGRRLEAVARSLDAARQAASGPAADDLMAVGEELRIARVELHDFAQGIRPSALGDGGLAAALPSLATRISIPVDVAVDAGRLPPAVEAAVYFVCSEALANVAKHAGATHAWLKVSISERQVVASIGDDGKGDADPSRGSGLRGLADRVEALGGHLTIDSSPGEGTRLAVLVPLDGGG